MPPQTASRRNFALCITLLAIVFAFVARQYLQRYALSATSAVAIYFSFLLSLTLALSPAVQWVRFVISSLFPGRRKFLFIPILLSPYFIYAIGTHDFRWIALFRLAALAVSAPLLYLSFPIGRPSTFAWQDALLAAFMMSAVLFQGLHGVFNVPVNLDFIGRLFLIALASWTWTFIRPVPGLGYEFVFSKQVLSAAAINFALFAAIALPLGRALHFITWNPHWHGVARFITDYLEIFLFIALLEELFFRGFLQNLLTRTFRERWAGQALASILFGFSHIFHAPVPNWRYVLLASIAGWCYGSAYRASGTILASGLTHALVDTTWRTWFTKI